MGVRSKARTIFGVKKITSLDQLPEWNYDGSSCYQASTCNSEIIIKPVAFFLDPFRGGNNVLVMTDTYVWEDNTYTKLKPANSNFRYFAKQIFDAHPDEEPWFGIEQEYILLDEKNRFTIHPYGWPKAGFPGN
jgi:glutamine synthetase